MAPIKFKWLVQLLEELDAARKRKADRGLSSASLVVVNWFKQHNHQIERHGRSAVAFLSCLFPERLPHRSYRLREKTLSTVISFALCLGATRAASLRSYEQRNIDFATAVEQVVSEAENCPSKDVTLEEIDDALSRIALSVAGISSTSPGGSEDNSALAVLSPIFRRLTSREAKWLVRMILKSYAPIEFPEQTVLRCFHFLLPELLVVKNSIEAAVTVLGHHDLRQHPHAPPIDQRASIRQLVERYLAPELGIMIKRQRYYKARSITHCYNMTDRRYMSVERKYDGEYCQIHIDRTRTPGCQIQIFSKSGKDSTNDRIRLHGAIIASLRLDEPDCPFKRNCILEGELLIWNRTKQEIAPFHVIRKHVMHGGRFLGINADSPRRLDEQLMIMFYDVLLVDNIGMLQQPHSARRYQLQKLVKIIPGVGELCYRKLVNFAESSSKDTLRKIFAQGIVQRWEGFVLKGNKDPYFNWTESTSVIKLKKDYITGLGDTADLCIVGGRRQQAVVDYLGLGELSWTSFHLACVENKEQILKDASTKPMFRILSVLDHHCLSRGNILYLNWRGGFVQFPWADSSDYFDVTIDQKPLRSVKPSELFKEPFVVEVMGAGFEKPEDTPYFVLRFPRANVARLHTDRTFMDTNTFDELQVMAKEALTRAQDSGRQEEAEWIDRLLGADGRQENETSTSSEATPAKVATSERWSSTVSPDTTLVLPSPRIEHRPSPVFIDLTDGDNTTEAHPRPRNEAPQVRRRLFQPQVLTPPPSSSPAQPITDMTKLSSPKKRLAAAEKQTLSAAQRTEHLGRATHPNPIPPFDPPARFRTPKLKTSATARSRRSSTVRQPLAEISNISPVRSQSVSRVSDHDLAPKDTCSKRRFAGAEVADRPCKLSRNEQEEVADGWTVPQPDRQANDSPGEQEREVDATQILAYLFVTSCLTREPSDDGLTTSRWDDTSLRRETNALSEPKRWHSVNSDRVVIRFLETTFPNVAAKEIQNTGRQLLASWTGKHSRLEDCQRSSLVTRDPQPELVVFVDQRAKSIIADLDHDGDDHDNDETIDDHDHDHNSHRLLDVGTTIKKYFVGMLAVENEHLHAGPEQLNTGQQQKHQGIRATVKVEFEWTALNPRCTR
ncbi:hypothetical protein PV10_04309 [Exophiala mesophila]|uniref:ATP-dependent DNA ligase family profile domain-containing protein n=1 Tax=Exophiala mesophila TaxID=212818 RepID=A0A0D1ZH14_EXOME|nr:uncharacterized protein PV10_04309 [Exophiala mesophila]KIV93064.1 hypothetical protein PV10_04309 [Exophiala mesophila]